MLPPQNTYHLPTFHRLPLHRLETFSQFQYLLSSRSRRKFCKRFNRICKHPRQKLFTKFPFDFPYRLIIDAKDKSNQELVLELMQFAIKFDLINRKVTDQSWNKKVEMTCHGKSQMTFVVRTMSLHIECRAFHVAGILTANISGEWQQDTSNIISSNEIHIFQHQLRKKDKKLMPCFRLVLKSKREEVKRKRS